MSVQYIDARPEPTLTRADKWCDRLGTYLGVAILAGIPTVALLLAGVIR